MPEELFILEQSKLKGMNEHNVTITNCSVSNISERVFEVANIGFCNSTNQNVLRYFIYCLI